MNEFNFKFSGIGIFDDEILINVDQFLLELKECINRFDVEELCSKYFDDQHNCYVVFDVQMTPKLRSRYFTVDLAAAPKVLGLLNEKISLENKVNRSITLSKDIYGKMSEGNEELNHIDFKMKTLRDIYDIEVGKLHDKLQEDLDELIEAKDDLVYDITNASELMAGVSEEDIDYLQQLRVRSF
jgi:hypothetical protein